MNFATMWLILLSVSLSATAQITLKLGMSSPFVQQAIAVASAFSIFSSILTTGLSWVV